MLDQTQVCSPKDFSLAFSAVVKPEENMSTPEYISIDEAALTQPPPPLFPPYLHQPYTRLLSGLQQPQAYQKPV